MPLYLRFFFYILILPFFIVFIGVFYSFEFVGPDYTYNNFSLLADALMRGELALSQCADLECSDFDGRIYLPFPPFPAVIAMPFVLVFGEGFNDFIILAGLFFIAIAVLWYRLFSSMVQSRQLVFLLLVSALLITPLYFALIRGGKLWFFSHITAFLLATMALYFATLRKNATLVGVCIGLAFMTRQLSLFHIPFLLYLFLSHDNRNISAPLVSRKTIISALHMLWFPALMVLITMAYNYVRFESPFDFGYGYSSKSSVLPGDNMLDTRIDKFGTHNYHYLLYNIFHLLFVGPGVEFIGEGNIYPMFLQRHGSSLFIASPFLLYYFLSKKDTLFKLATVTIFASIAVAMFYHSNGFSQYTGQRYILDWMPIALFIIARAVTMETLPVFRVLTIWGLILNSFMVFMPIILSIFWISIVQCAPHYGALLLETVNCWR